MHSNKYITVYTLVMTLVVSVVLAIVVTGLSPMHGANEAVFKKREILGAIANKLGQDLAKMKDNEVLTLFNERIEQVVLDANGKPVEGLKAEEVDMAKEEKKPKGERRYPLFIYKGEQDTIYLLSVRGNGLWDKIWGTIALSSDMNTILGTSFGHVAETPGLGAEIKDNPNFPRQFEGKKIYKGDQYVSVVPVKGGVRDKEHQVDAISGATITSVGVANMMQHGIEAYLPYFQTLKK